MKKGSKSKPKAGQKLRPLLAKAAEAEKQLEHARTRARLAKGLYKKARKEVKLAKKSARKARKEAKAAAKMLGVKLSAAAKLQSKKIEKKKPKQQRSKKSPSLAAIRTGRSQAGAVPMPVVASLQSSAAAANNH